jgi:hypothetical protein
MDYIAQYENFSEFPAFEWIENNLNAGSGLNGYTDWYLPARDELEIGYRHFKPTTQGNYTDSFGRPSTTSGFGGDGQQHGTNNSSDPSGSGYTTSNPSQTGITSFQGSNSDALEDGYYWSSTERVSSFSWRQRFLNGSQDNLNKDLSNRVRAVRRVAL